MAKKTQKPLRKLVWVRVPPRAPALLLHVVMPCELRVTFSFTFSLLQGKKMAPWADGARFDCNGFVGWWHSIMSLGSYRMRIQLCVPFNNLSWWVRGYDVLSFRCRGVGVAMI